MAADQFEILSLNCRGLRKKKQKRKNLFYWIKQKQYHTIFLQETFWTDDIKKDIEKEWSGKPFFNPGTAHSKGIAILFNNSVIDKNFSHDIKNVHMSEDGRIILINLVVENKEFTLINVYSPNSPKERKCFFNKIGKWISNFFYKQ